MSLGLKFLKSKKGIKYVVYNCHRIKMELEAVFQAKTLVKIILTELPPCRPPPSPNSEGNALRTSKSEPAFHEHFFVTNGRERLFAGMPLLS